MEKQRVNIQKYLYIARIIYWYLESEWYLSKPHRNNHNCIVLFLDDRSIQFSIQLAVSGVKVSRDFWIERETTRMAFCSRSRRKFSYIQLTGRFENPLTSSRNRRTFCFSFFINNKTSLASFFEIFPLLPSQEREPLNSRFVPLQRTFIPDGKVSNYPRDLSLH